MRTFIRHTGIVAPLDRVNVDTDQMVPKQFLKLISREGYGRFLFYDWRYLQGEKLNPEFILNQPRYRGASILLARDNFGCGSSREHAPWALLDYGFHALVAPSFADIFRTNCFKNGILPVTLGESGIDELFRRAGANAGYCLTVDLENQTVSDTQGFCHSFQIAPFRRECLMKGLDDIGLTLEFEDQIAAYEKSHRPSAAMSASVNPSPVN